MVVDIGIWHGDENRIVALIIGVLWRVESVSVDSC